MAEDAGGTVLARAVVVLEGDSSKFESMMSAAEQRMTKVGEHLTEIGHSLSTKITLPLTVMAGLAVKAFKDQTDAMTRVQSAIKATGGVAGTSAAEIDAMAKSLEETTNFTEDATDAAGALLLSFTNIRNQAGKNNDIFDRTIRASQDMAAAMGGDVSSAAQQLGRALQDPTIGLMMLQRAGVSFTAAEQAQIKILVSHNDLLGAQKAILQKVETQFKGTAEALAKSPAGQLTHTWNELNKVMGDFGGIIVRAIQPALKWIDDLVNKFHTLNPAAQKIVAVMLAIAAAIGPLLVVVGTLMSAFAAIGVVIGVSAGTVGLIVAAIAAVIAAGVALVSHWTWVKLQVVSFWAMLKETYYAGVLFIIDMVQKFLTVTGNMLGFLKKLPGPLKILGNLATPFEQGAVAVGKFKDAVQVVADKTIAASGIEIQRLEEQLKHAGDTADKTAEKIKKSAPAKSPPPLWEGPVLDALSKLGDATALSTRKQQLLGDAFNKADADAQAYATAIDAIIQAVGNDHALDGFIKGLTETQKLLEAKSVWDNMQVGLKRVQEQAKLLGPQFDEASARVQVLQDAVNQFSTLPFSDVIRILKKLGISIDDDVIKKLRGAQIDTLLNNYKLAMQGVATMTTTLGAQYDAASAKAQLYGQYVQGLIDGHYTLEEVQQKTGMSIDQLINKMQNLNDVSQLASKLRETFTGALDALVEFAFTGKASIGDFVRSAIMDLTKLILEMYALKALKHFFPGSDLFGNIASAAIPGHANGGVIGAGELGIVGERGPELISAGANPIRVTPLPAQHAAPVEEKGMGGTVKVELNVNAMDSRDVERFFDENTALVGNAMVKAWQRSSALRRMSGGR